MTHAPRSLRSQLVAELVMLASAAVVLVGIITALVAGADFRALAVPLLLFWAGSTAVLLLFGLHLLKRQVLRPLNALAAEADAYASGDRPLRFAQGDKSSALGAQRDEFVTLRPHRGRRGGARAWFRPLRFAQGDRRSALTAEYETREFQLLAERYRAMAADLLDAQGQVVRQEKLAGIGRLAAGVAHEVRNPLGAIGTYLEVLRQRGTDRQVVDEMRGAVDRIERIVASLLDYARPAPPTGRTQLSGVVRRASSFLESQGALRGRELDILLPEGAPEVTGDAHALEQVVINLLLNARDAASRRVAVSVHAHVLGDRRGASAREGDDADVRRLRPRSGQPLRRDLPAGTSGVLLVVADDGPGIPDEERERVFDPFFTTKDPGQGTGLGLAIVARTVHEAGGIVWVDRAREGGAAFKVFLPGAEMGRERCAS